MNWPGIRVLRGANVWAPCPALEVEVEGGEATEDAGRVRRALGLLRAACPETEEAEVGDNHQEALARALGLLALTLQRQTGSLVGVLVAQPTRPGTFQIIVEFEEEELGVACLEAARRLCRTALQGGEPDLLTELALLRELAHEVRLGPSTAAIVAAARQQNIPILRLNSGNLVQLGHGIRQRRIWTAETDRTGAIAEVVAQDKDLTRQLLRGVGVPVPEGRPVSDAEDAWEAADEIGTPVVVKPRYGNHGRGVVTNLLTREQVTQAFAAAREHGDEVVVERYVSGNDHRLLVVGGLLVAASLRKPPQVVGDGRATVAELVANLNRDPRRSDGHATALSLVKLDAIALAFLAEQGHAPDSVPTAGECVLIRRTANLSTGGTATDVTDQVHPRTAASAVAAARAVGLDIAGVDMVTPAIDQPLRECGGAVIEVNAGPGLRMHLEPSTGTPRPVGEAIIRMLFPGGACGRIPVAVATSDSSRPARILAQLLTAANHVVGVAGVDGLSVGGRQIDPGDSSGPQGARAILLNPRVTAAVLEASGEGILREGLGFDRCDVALVSSGPHGLHPESELPAVAPAEDRVRLARAVVRTVAPEGVAILDAADPLIADVATACSGSVVYYACTENKTVTAHLARDGRAVLAAEGLLVFACGASREVLMPLDEVPCLRGQGGFEVRDALAAAGAARALGLPNETIRLGLASFMRAE